MRVAQKRALEASGKPANARAVAMLLFIMRGRRLRNRLLCCACKEDVLKNVITPHESFVGL